MQLLATFCHSDLLTMSSTLSIVKIKRDRTPPLTVVFHPFKSTFKVPYTTMIRAYSLFFKLIRTKISSQAIFSSFMENFNPALEVCPHCGSKGNCHPFAYYDRHLVDFVHGHVCDSSIHILRVQCSSCHHTHAILPDIIVPYASYSLFSYSVF